MSGPTRDGGAGGVSNLEFLLLGTGTSAGIPVIGCACRVCRSVDERDRRLRCGACLRFRDAGGAARTILIDVPPDHREQSLRHGLDRCDGILFTHDHVDHTFGLDEVRRYNALMGVPIDVFAEAPVLDSLRRVYRHVFDRGSNVNRSFVADLVPREIDSDRPIDLFGLRFTPIRLLHGRLPILGFRIEALGPDGRPSAEQPGPLPLAYCTDCNAIPPASWPLLEGLDTLVLDLLRHRRHPTHFSTDEAIETATRIGAGRTVFIHMTHDVGHAELEERMPPGMAPGHDGLRLV
ncbi:MAG: MBL fold metallo-hydrolase [Phycisphaerales bacterium]